MPTTENGERLQFIIKIRFVAKSFSAGLLFICMCSFIRHIVTVFPVGLCIARMPVGEEPEHKRDVPASMLSIFRTMLMMDMGRLPK
ncbi:MAG: hypothetical protein VR65_21945 [Desulfobulbaceae bacterium BRH_c16a]|nr:MAG: hypothetical protein VR65_21945 [Desulfobulbaceae bacterium BRH_c16a]